MSDDGGPEDSVSEADAALGPPGELTAAEDDFSPFEEEKEDFELRPGRFVSGADGLPAQVDETSVSRLPVLNHETLVCMADKSKFVLRNNVWGDVNLVFTPDEVEEAPDGRFRVTRAVAMRRFTEARDAKLAGDRVIGDIHKPPEIPALSARIAPDDLYVIVEPIRPECQHYVRMQIPQYNLDLPLGARPGVTRLCGARRNTEGAMMRINDLEIYACSMRRPYDVASSKALDEFDKKKIHQGETRVYVPIKGNAPEQPSDGAGGIFGGAT